MKLFRAFLALISGVLCPIGCMSRTYIATGARGVPSPDGSYRLVLKCHGAYGRSYIEKSKHGAQVGIWTGTDWTKVETNVFWHQYAMVASDLWGHIHWESSQKVAVDFYDYGDGVSRYDAKKAGASSNYIKTVSFRLDNQSRKFIEEK